TAGSINTREFGLSVEGAFLRMHTTLEASLEELFFGLLLGRLSTPTSRRIRPLVGVRTETYARRLVLAGEDFVSWLPYRETVSRAERFLLGGRPFTLLNDGERSMIARLHYTRNAIAHRSDHSLRVFEQKVLGDTPLTSAERRPSGYLAGLA